jgi:hypothetical protein
VITNEFGEPLKLWMSATKDDVDLCSHLKELRQRMDALGCTIKAAYSDCHCCNGIIGEQPVSQVACVLNLLKARCGVTSCVHCF